MNPVRGPIDMPPPPPITVAAWFPLGKVIKEPDSITTQLEAMKLVKL
jgi:hypothetical protein